MKLPRKIRLFRSLKVVPLAIIFGFLFSNFTGIFFSRALAPEVSAAEPALGQSPLTFHHREIQTSID
jgi:hypothetical protein